VPVLLWDASALVKRYYPEAGSATIDALFAAAAGLQMITTFWGYAETFASLWRKRNRGEISTASFGSAVILLRDEVRRSPAWELLTIDDISVLAGLDLVQQHNLNTSDAAILDTYLRYSRSRPPGGLTLVLVAADTRLLRAADAEGLTTLNPETVAAAGIPTLLSAW
jgi:predicted nucleic acid-binding protein